MKGIASLVLAIVCLFSMSKRLYYEMMLSELAKQDTNKKKRLLLHSCCAPCNGYVVKYLSEYFDLTLYFNNSNIFPQSEYTRRLEELKRFVSEFNQDIAIIETPYNIEYQKDFFNLSDEMEGGSRCKACYTRRMKEAYSYADQEGFDYFTTVMSISSHKDSIVLNQIGEILAKDYKTKYFYSDFKKNNGILKASEVAREYQMYRQDYCGCVYSIRRPENTTLDYLPNTNLFLYQRKDMFRFNTDTRLLGEYLKIKPSERVLDIGCNNGALMLYASLQGPKELVGVDIQEEAITLAKTNLTLNGITNYQLLTLDINDYTDEKFDVIMVNPPYFKGDNIKDNPYLNKARHQLTLSDEQLIEAFIRLLKADGRVYLVYRYDLFEKLSEVIKAKGLEIIEIQNVYEKRKERYQSILVTLSFQTVKLTQLPDIYLPF